MPTIMDDLNTLREQLEMLQVENGLLRAASNEQRELNGELRQTIQASDDSMMALSAWCNWFGTWGSLVHGVAYAECFELSTKTKSIVSRGK